MASALNYTIGISARAFLAGMRSCVSATQGLAAAARGTVGAMHALNGASELVARALGPIKGLVGAMAEAVGAAGDLESTAVAYKTLLGSAEKAQAVMGRLRALAASTPFESKELLDAGRKLIAFGESGDQVHETLRRLGDVASGVQKDIGELAETYGKARVAGVLYAEEINEFTSAGVPLIQQLSKVLKVNEDQVKKLASEGKVSFAMLEESFKNLTDKGGMFFNMMKEQSTTFNGLLSALKDSWAALKQAFAEPVMLALKPALEDSTKLLDGMKSQAAAIGQELGKWTEYIAGAFSAGQGWEALLGEFKLGALKVVNAIGAALVNVGEVIGNKLKHMAISMAALLPMGGISKEEAANRHAQLGGPRLPYNLKDALKGDSGPMAEDIFVEEQQRKAREAAAKQARMDQAWEKRTAGNMRNVKDHLFGVLDKPEPAPAKPKALMPGVSIDLAATMRSVGLGVSQAVGQTFNRVRRQSAAQARVGRMGEIKDRLKDLAGSGRENPAREAFLARRAVRQERQGLRKELSALKKAGKTGLAAAKTGLSPQEKDVRRSADALERLERKLTAW